MDSDAKLWVGISRRLRDLVVVYDAELQVRGSNHVNLYSLLSNAIMVFPRKSRDNLQTLHGEKRAAAILRYLAWKDEHAKTFISAAHDALTSKKEALLASHQKRVESLGIPYRGTHTNHQSSHKITHCRSCGEQLDSIFDISCAACNWLICNSCAACGCGFLPR